jgi:thioredoxin 2
MKKMEQPHTRIISCTKCGAKNRIPPERNGAVAKCGKCGASLQTEERNKARSAIYTIRCMDCRTKNRVPQDRLDAGAKCGKCKAPLKTDKLFIPQPIIITDNNFPSKVLESPLPVLLFCWAPWCPSCRTVAPIIDAFATESKGKVRVGKLNVDQSPRLSSEFNILSVPYLFIFDNGHMRESMPGGMDKHQIMMKMARYL